MIAPQSLETRSYISPRRERRYGWGSNILTNQFHNTYSIIHLERPLLKCVWQCVNETSLATCVWNIKMRNVYKIFFTFFKNLREYLLFKIFFSGYTFDKSFILLYRNMYTPCIVIMILRFKISALKHSSDIVRMY